MRGDIMSQRRRGGRGRLGGPYAAGPGGYCICPICGNRELHRPGVPCANQICSKCNSRMIRE